MNTLALIALVSFSYGQSFQLYEGDTINVVDNGNLKQGHWIYFGNMKRLPGYDAQAKVEEGAYKDSRKNGKWTKFYPSQKVQNEIVFVNNRPNGEYIIYYENGQVQEQGNWKSNRNTGKFVRFYENGNKQQEFNFNSSGKREGKQTYFHENGQVMIEGDWAGGKEDGGVKEYYANGELKAEKHFGGGVMDASKTKTYEPKQPVKEIVTEEKGKAAPKVTSDQKVNVGLFDGNGQHTLYNKNRQISQKGMFKGGRLWDGKWYRYDKNGILQSVEIYKAGRYVGEGVIEED